MTEQLWEDLGKGKMPSSGLMLRRFPPDFLPEIEAALRLPEQFPALVIRVEDTAILESILRYAFRDLKISLMDSGKSAALSIELQNPTLREIFAVLCDDLAQHLKRETSPAIIARELRNRLHQWSLLFEKAAAPGLSPEEQRGLYGELAVLQILLENAENPVSVLNGWFGPAGGIHDFFYTDRAIEVKTTFGNQHQTVTISNAAQLDENGLAFLWLVHLALENETKPTGRSLNDQADFIFSILEHNAEATQLFRVRLLHAGFFEQHRPEYENAVYRIRSFGYYHVQDEFPRICTGELRVGIQTLKYTIRLADCQPWLTDSEQLLTNLPILRYEPPAG